MNANEPSAGTEPGAAAGSQQPSGPADQPVASNPHEEYSSTGDGARIRSEEPVEAGSRRPDVDPGAPGSGEQPAFRQPGPQQSGEQPGLRPQAEPFQGTGPGFSPPEHPPRWATGPNDPERASYTFPPHGSGGRYDQFTAQHGGHTPPGQNVPHGPGAPGEHHQGQHPYGGGGSFGTGGYGGHGGYGGQPPFGGPPHGEASGPGRKRGLGGIITIAAITALITSLIVGPAAALGTAFLFPNGLSGPVSSLSGEPEGTQTQGAVGEVADTILPSVVSIQTPSGGGSGVVISSDGQILTNAHVAEASQGGPMEVLFNDGTSARAEILGSDPVSDIAVLKAEGRNDLQPAELGDSDKVGVGAEVVAIGSPLGLTGTVTTGVVSALNRPVNTGATESANGQTSTVINAIQTDAAINPGNSGGPLVNMNGEVIGINTAIAGISQDSGSVGLGFAIPINQVRPIAEQLIEDGSASYPAIEATITNSRVGGAEIVDVTSGGAAAEAGIQTGDVVVSVDGEEVSTPDELIAQIRVRQPGEEVTLGVLPGGSGPEEEVTVTLGEQSSDSAQTETGNEGD
ncbi:peptidase S1 [Nocardiopsis sp. TSRI0078]|uniref:S1C family serine protease n=1 Tax=unclassified Nocardiopsis TaxID=2649073 RepID=UPI00093CA44E|nr:trypsin-like peptidase domain-containing protein [Nocardiopsis sp. TSRI0078]OKI23268.1 peptidase S1 [Nocardiopsis sp. TSRI0078]